jgi:hypothetical protein
MKNIILLITNGLCGFTIGKKAFTFPDVSPEKLNIILIIADDFGSADRWALAGNMHNPTRNIGQTRQQHQLGKVLISS